MLTRLNIVFEGTDCAGKTTLLRTLKARYPEFCTMHQGKVRNRAEGLQQNQDTVEMMNRHTGILLDRTLLLVIYY